ncbi:hypothetical protein DOTSEDRAFT_22888 [Dothistroma septosporum NZE10]|uniref:Uncharacterized protein n=1 Tax=Dothistroma septosporum (strain NZE10 / CBS 128990) TaxID=675120 RepID=N1PXC4_DOTSN|nr:hypothetical protein DOTSEDRAFT_22888 [Dothistroma septosporum NZE10]
MCLGSSGLPSQSWEELHRLQIHGNVLDPAAPWPMTFDPHFTMVNIGSGKQAEPCDLLQIMSSKETPKIPKAGAMTRKGMNSFSCHDVRWLITTIRQCLARFKMSWTEYLTTQETGFAAHYEAVDAGIATMYFFNIAIFRPTFRPGYVAEVCPDGMCSARIRRSEPNTEKGVHHEEVKRIKQRVREYLEAALARQDMIDMQGTAMPVVSANGATGMHRRVSVKAVRQGSSPGSSVVSRPESVRS